MNAVDTSPTVGTIVDRATTDVDEVAEAPTGVEGVVLEVDYRYLPGVTAFRPSCM